MCSDCTLASEHLTGTHEGAWAHMMLSCDSLLCVAYVYSSKSGYVSVNELQLIPELSMVLNTTQHYTTHNSTFSLMSSSVLKPTYRLPLTQNPLGPRVIALFDENGSDRVNFKRFVQVCVCVVWQPKPGSHQG